MATELAKAYVQIIPSADGIKGSITSALGGEAESAGDSAGSTLGSRLVSAAVKVISAAGIGKLISSAITEGADLEQSIGGIETLFGDSADKMKEYAAAAYETAGISANDYMEQATSFAASLLSSLEGDTEAAAESANQAIIDMADNSNKMGTSLEAIQNAYQGFAKQNYTMLDNLKLGYGGTKTEMERLLADAEKLSGVEYDIDNLSDVYEAIHVIQEDLGITGTTAEEAATTFSGSMASMKAAASNLLGYLATGGDVTSAMSDLMSTVFTFVQGNLVPMIGRILSGVPEILETGLSGIVRGLNIVKNNSGEILQMGLDIVTGIASSIITSIPYLAEAAVKLVASFGNTILETDWTQTASDFMTDLSDGLSMAAGEIFGSDDGIITALLNSVSAKLPDVLEKGVEIVSSLANGILENLPQIITAVGEGLSNLLSFIGQNLPFVLQAGKELLQNLAQGIQDNLPEIKAAAVKTISNLIVTIAQNLPQILQSGIELIGQLAVGIITAIPTVVSSVLNVISGVVIEFSNYDWGQIGKDLIEGIKNGLVNAATSLADAASQIWSELLTSVKSFFGIASPSTVMEEQGGYLVQGMINGISSLPGDMSNVLTEALTNVERWGNSILKSAGTAALNAVDQVNTRFSQLPQKVKNWLNSVLSNVGSWGSSLLTSAGNAASNAVSKVNSTFSTLPGLVGNWLNSTISNVTSFASNLAATGSSAASGFVNNLVNGVSGLPAQFISIGSNIVSGIWNGISSGWSWLNDQVSSLANSLLSTAKSALGISSPSKAFRDEVGKWIPAGIAEGITGNTDSISNALQTALNSSVSGVQSDIMMGVSQSQRTIGQSVSAGSGNMSGYTQTIQIYSPTSLTPSEVARQTRNATRNMVLAMKGV